VPQQKSVPSLSSQLDGFDKFLQTQRIELPKQLAGATGDQQRAQILDAFFDTIEHQRNSINLAVASPF